MIRIKDYVDELLQNCINKGPNEYGIIVKNKNTGLFIKYYDIDKLSVVNNITDKNEEYIVMPYFIIYCNALLLYYKETNYKLTSSVVILNACRYILDITINSLATKLEIPKVNVQNWLYGFRNIKIDTCIKLSKITNIKFDTIMYANTMIQIAIEKMKNPELI